MFVTILKRSVKLVLSDLKMLRLFPNHFVWLQETVILTLRDRKFEVQVHHVKYSN